MRAHLQETSISTLGLAGLLRVPPGPVGLVLFAHGSGSSRHSPRNNAVAEAFEAAGIATLLFDLLTRVEELDRANVFDVDLLAGRLIEAVEWARCRPDLGSLPLGLFGASTGAAAALVAAARLGDEVAAVVSRGGRPDLAGDALDLVVAPTLLIVGGADQHVLELNRRALTHLKPPSRLQIIPGATHLFPEPGALDLVIDSALRWFETRFAECRRSGRASSVNYGGAHNESA